MTVEAWRWFLLLAWKIIWSRANRAFTRCLCRNFRAFTRCLCPKSSASFHFYANLHLRFILDKSDCGPIISLLFLTHIKHERQRNVLSNTDDHLFSIPHNCDSTICFTKNAMQNFSRFSNLSLVKIEIHLSPFNLHKRYFLGITREHCKLQRSRLWASAKFSTYISTHTMLSQQISLCSSHKSRKYITSKIIFLEVCHFIQQLCHMDKKISQKIRIVSYFASIATTITKYHYGTTSITSKHFKSIQWISWPWSRL